MEVFEVPITEACELLRIQMPEKEIKYIHFIIQHVEHGI